MKKIFIIAILLLRNYSILRIFQIIEAKELFLKGKSLEFGASINYKKNFSHFSKGENNFQQEFNNIKPNLVYYDVIYNPNETTMIQKFNKRGVKTFNGLEMFICQGQKSFCLWNKINPDSDEILKETLVKKSR